MVIATGSPSHSGPLGHISGTLHATGTFLVRHQWVSPLLGTLLLIIFGWWVHRSVEGAMRAQLVSELTTILNADKTALTSWLASARADAASLAEHPGDRSKIQALIEISKTQGDATRLLLMAPPLAELRRSLAPQLKILGYEDFLILDPSMRVVAASDDLLLGKVLGGYEREFMEKVFAHRAAISLPHPSRMLLQDFDGEYRAGVPTMFAAAPVAGSDGKPFAILALRLRPEKEFTQILKVARSGLSGETYAFDRQGVLLSLSRFDDQLKQIGLLADRKDVWSILNIVLRDPGVNMVEGERPKKRRADQPLTRMAADATAGNSNFDVGGYRDYRGMYVVGAWTWLPEYEMGIATEVDVWEAFRPLRTLRIMLWGLMSLQTLTTIVIFAFGILLERQRNTLRHIALDAKRIGHYVLEQKIGTGGMGSVYLGHHDLLTRPTAIKLLDIDKISESTTARFEREVQLTSQLNHPNTIAIYDYGRTPEGLFYYAMEYVEGINLEELVMRFGAVPEGRVVKILEQVCGSLAEAHSVGLVHRDIKPANILLSYRGGIYDFVKVLDFGLVKAVDVDRAGNLTAEGALTGTPLYLSPEAIEYPETVDARSDLYAVGALGYFLLTGTPVFRGTSLLEICMQQVRSEPESPSRRLGRPISPDLEALILTCLAKDRQNRPTSAEALRGALMCCNLESTWTRDEAAEWWSTKMPQGTRGAANSQHPSGVLVESVVVIKDTRN